MISESLARRYALALFNLSVEREMLEQIHEEFGVIRELVSSKDKFRYFLFSPKVETDEKKQVIVAIFGDNISKTMLHFLYLLLDKKRQILIEKMQSHFVKLYNNHYNKAIITVRPAVPMEDSIYNELKTLFEKKLNKQVTVQEEVDASLIGGLQVRIDNTVYDASVATKLDKMRKTLITG